MKNGKAKEPWEIGAKLVMSERPLQIKLLGDSVTYGSGTESCRADGDVILTSAEAPMLHEPRRNTHGCSWANLFADYIKQVCGCTVVNNAIGGTGIRDAIRYFDSLVSEDDDIVLVMYGANDRTEVYPGDGTPVQTREQYMRDFYACVKELREKLDAAGKEYVFLSGPPDGTHSECVGEISDRLNGRKCIRHFCMWDINNMLMKDSVENDYPFIPVYTKMEDFFFLRGANPLDYHEWTKGNYASIHLNEAGSRLVYRIVLEGLGLAPIAYR